MDYPIVSRGNLIQLLQNMAARFVTGAGNFDH